MPDYIGSMSDENVLTTRRVGDIHPRLVIEADGTIKTGNGLKPPQNLLRSLLPSGWSAPMPIRTMSSLPTFAATTNVTSYGAPQNYSVSGGNPATLINYSFWSSPVGINWFVGTGTSQFYARSTSVYDGQPGSGVTKISAYIDAADFEISYHGQAGRYRVWVDGELATTEAGLSIPNDNLRYYQKITFATKAVRLIEIEGYNYRFGGFLLNPTDSISPGPVNAKPRCLIIGDSFTDGTGSNQVDNWAVTFGALMGWDVWTAGIGGSGYSTGTKFSLRIPYFTGIPFDVIIVAGGWNDYGVASTVAAEARKLFSLINAEWPQAFKVAGPIWPTNIAEYNLGATKTIWDAISSEAAIAGFAFVNPSEQPLTAPVVNSTMTTNASAGASTIVVNNLISPISTIEIGTGLATVERKEVLSVSGVSPTTLTLNVTLSNAHNAGETVRVVGKSWISGSGRVGATTGVGNRDLYISSDNVHPTPAGHRALAVVWASLICNALKTSI